MSSEPAAKKGGDAGGAFKGFLIFFLLVIMAGAGGYFFGTYQKFAPIQYVPAGTPGAISSTPASSTNGAPASTTLKKKYWLHSRGYERIGYAITVFVNGQLADKIYSPDRNVDITKFVKPGENQINFQAKVLPAGMREHAGDPSYYMTINLIASDIFGGGYKDGDVLLNYKRNANEGQDFNDTMTFVTVE